MDDENKKDEIIDQKIDDDELEDIEEEDEEYTPPSNVIDLEELRRERIKALLIKQQKERENTPPSANDILAALNIKTFEHFNLNNILCGPYMDDMGLHVPCVGLEHDQKGNPLIYYQLIPINILAEMVKKVITVLDKENEENDK